MPVKATAIFEADDRSFSAAVGNIQRKMLTLQRNLARLAVGGSSTLIGGIPLWSRVESYDVYVRRTRTRYTYVVYLTRTV